MESASVLESIAEVAIALAGFGGIAAGLGYRARGIWSPDDRMRLLALAGNGLAVVFGCFFPYLTHNLGFAAPWRIASVLFFFVVASFFFYLIGVIARGGLPAGASRIVSWLVLSGMIGTLALLLTVVLGYAGPREFGFYLSAILLTLAQASLFFVRLLVTAFRDNEPAA